jgi:methyl-accepting chemotaxis protein
MQGRLAAIDRSQAVIEFALDGTILSANDNFLRTMGYRIEEIRGQNHSMFVEPAQRDSHAYRVFWDKLRAGMFDAGEYLRIASGGRKVWIQASYNPVLDRDGTPVSVVKFATDITPRKLAEAEARGIVEALDRVQAVIEFSLDGTVIAANRKFLAAVGYRIDEIRGQHHAPEGGGAHERRLQGRPGTTSPPTSWSRTWTATSPT